MLLLILATILILVVAGIPALLLNQQVATSLATRRYENAEQWLTWCHRLRIGNAETTFLKARLARKLLQLREVPPLLQQALQQGFDRRTVQREYILLEAQAGRLPSVINELNTMLTQETHDGAEICEAYVNGAAMMGSVELAETIISNWKQAYPHDPQPFYARARILEYQQRTPEALEELNTAILKDPQHWPSLYARSRMASGQGRLREALADALAAATGMQWNSAPLLQQARCLLDLAEPLQARQVLEKIQSRPPQDLQHSFNLVCEPERGLPLEAELGRAEAALGHTQQAVDWFNKVLDRDPRNPAIRYERAICLQVLGQTQVADAELESVRQSRERLSEIDRLADVIRERPELPHVAERCRIGELFLLYDDARRGEFGLKDALNHDPQYQPAHRLLTDYYDGLAKEDTAWKILADQHRAALAPP
jgi:tetratricopeptide (TPR) repeat protein